MKQFTKYIADDTHYTEVIQRIQLVKRQLWIGTADIKDLYVARGKQAVPLLAVLAGLIRKGVEIRLIHAKEPGPASSPTTPLSLNQPSTSSTASGWAPTAASAGARPSAATG